jgi:hypothetical protein
VRFTPRFKLDAFAKIPLCCHCEESRMALRVNSATPAPAWFKQGRQSRFSKQLLTSRLLRFARKEGFPNLLRDSQTCALFFYIMYSPPRTCYDNLVLLCWHTMLATRGMLLYLSSGAMAVSVAVRNKDPCGERAFVQPP